MTLPQEQHLPFLPLNANVAIYRRSMALQISEQESSLIHDLVALAEQHGWKESQIILLEDKGVSASAKSQLPNFRGFLTLIEQRKVKAVIVDDEWHISRDQEIDPKFRELLTLVEQDKIKAVIVNDEWYFAVDISGKGLTQFVRLCIEHDVYLITPLMTYYFCDHVQLGQFIAGCTSAFGRLEEQLKERFPEIL